MFKEIAISMCGIITLYQSENLFSHCYRVVIPPSLSFTRDTFAHIAAMPFFCSFVLLS